MSTFEIKMPKLGESITEGTIVSWSVKVGDNIKEDDVLFEVTTAKVNAEIPSPVEGTMLEIIFKEGDTVPVGGVVAIIQLGEIDNSVVAEKTETVPLKAVTPEFSDSSATGNVSQSIHEENKEKSEDSRWYSPVVLRLASEAKISTEELDKITGTGYLGRLSKNDINNYILQKEKGTTAPIVAKKPLPVPPPLKPLVQIEPVSELVPPTTAGDNTETKDMDIVGRIIADRMVMSKKVSAHVTTVVEVDVTKLVNWRNKQKDAFLKHEGISLTFMPAIVEATAKALIEFPKVNASVDGYRYILKKQINVGIAVSLDDGNLIVPVVHNADKLSISGLALAINNLAGKARANKLTLDDIQGGTFTITNFGTFRNIIGTPIINQPEVAILGVGYIEKKPAVIETPDGDMIAIRHKMYLSLSYDHRIINGAMGGAFLKRIADYLENWEAG
jgi:Pyruvate/2-oxoglutarate dehydrogenase complex, dihydrolipoamide acyltransferase (E2) component, and related enzymes